MNKLFSKIASLTLGLGLAVGVGVAIGRNGVQEVKADTPDVGTRYELVNDVKDLVAGANYILANGTSGDVDVASTTSNNNNRRATDGTVVDGGISFTSTMLNLELGGESGSWTFKTTNYLGTNGYLASASGGDNNYLRVIAAVTTASVSFEGDAAVISLKPHSSRKIIMFNNNLFACYSASSSFDDVYLYKQIVKSISSLVPSGDYKNAYYEGEAFDPTGLTVTINYDDDTQGTAPLNEIKWTPEVLTTETTKVTGTYKGSTFQLDVTVAADTLQSVTVSGSMTKTEYKLNDNWDPAGLVVTANYTGKGNVVVTDDAEWTFEPETATSTSITSVKATATFNEISGYKDCEVTVSEIVNPTIVSEGDHLNLGDELYIVNGSKAAGEMPADKDFLSAVDVTVEDGVITDSGDALAFVLGAGVDGCTLANENKLLGASAAKSLKYDAGTLTWEITVGESNVATISSTKSSNGSIQYNTSSPRFLNYATAQTDVVLYRVPSSDSRAAKIFENEYLHMNDYSESKGWCADSEHNYYAYAKQAFRMLNDAQKALLSEADLLRLAAWAEANGETFNSSTGEFTTTSSPIGATINSQPGYVILIAMTTIGIASFGVTILLKRRKEDK